MISLPDRLEPFTDAYFLRSKYILEKEGLNPFVRYQVFLRDGPGRVYGMSEAYTIIERFTKSGKEELCVSSLDEGEEYKEEESILIIEGRVQNILNLETMLLGVISAETTKNNDHYGMDLDDVTKNVAEIVELTSNRPVLFMGARHWRYDEDEAISNAAFEGGATDVSTEIGAATYGKKAVGTIPHALEVVFAYRYGMDHAVVESVKAFDKHIEQSVPRIALVDFNNHEIDDSLAAAKVLGKRLFGVRIDTPGEVAMQGQRSFSNHKDDPFWFGNGVTIGGVYSVRKALDKNGFANVKIVLTSGFGNPQKVKAFVAAEKELGVKLFDVLGVGKVFPVRAATMDIVGVGETMDTIKPLAKAGRTYRPNPRLHSVL